MSTSVFVGNISWNTSEDQLRDLLSQAGDLRDFRMICDRETGRPWADCLQWYRNEDMLSQAGNLRDFKMIYDRDTGRPRGFGFAEFGDPASAKQAIQQLNGYELDGRPLKVNESQGRSR